MAHYEPPHQDQRCLQIQLFSSLVVKELNVFFVSASCTARSCFKAAKRTAKVSLCWLWCGGASILTIIILVFLILFLMNIVPVVLVFILFYTIGVLVWLLVRCIRTCLYRSDTSDACKDHCCDRRKFEEELCCRFCGCTAGGELVNILILIICIPMAIVLMLVALSYLLMAGALWCGGKRGVKKPAIQSPVALPEAPVYIQTIDCDLTLSGQPGHPGRMSSGILATPKRGFKQATTKSQVVPDVHIYSVSTIDCDLPLQSRILTSAVPESEAILY